MVEINISTHFNLTFIRSRISDAGRQGKKRSYKPGSPGERERIVILGTIKKSYENQVNKTTGSVVTDSKG